MGQGMFRAGLAGLFCAALPSVSASHDAIATLADLPAAIARYLEGLK